MRFLRGWLLIALLGALVVPVSAHAQTSPWTGNEPSPLSDKGAVREKPAKPSGAYRERPAEFDRTTASRTTAAAEAPAVSHLVMRSAPGDWVGAGRTHSYSTVNNDGFGWQVNGSLLTVSITTADTYYSIDMKAPNGERIEVGDYLRATRYPFNSPGVPGLDVTGDHRGCNESNGHFKVQEAVYNISGGLDRFRATFQQYCDGGPPLTGEVRLGIVEAPPMPPVVPPTPAQLVMVSEPGDWVGAGQTWTHSQPALKDSFSWYASNSAVRIWIDTAADGSWWDLTFSTPNGVDLVPGHYPGATRASFKAPGVPGMDVGGHGRGCNELTGWFTVYEAEFGSDDNFAHILKRLDLIFEQHCDGGPALTGEVRLGIPEPYFAMPTVNRRGTVDRLGEATVSGKVACTSEGTASFNGTATQRIGTATASEPISFEMSCTSIAAGWQVALTSGSGTPFRAGPIQIEGNVTAEDPYGQSDVAPLNGRTRLVPGRRR